MIEVTGLSSVTDTESLRVSGLGNARLLVANCIHEQFIEIPDSDQIRALKSQKRELEVEMEAIIAEIEILDEFGEEMGHMPDLTPDQANTFTDTFIEKTLACVKTVGELEDKIEEVNRRIDKAKSEKTGSAFVKAVITIAANDTGPVQLKLTYRQPRLTVYQLFVCSSIFRRERRLLVSSLRSVRHFGRRETIEVCVPSLPRQLATEYGGGLG